MTEGIEAFAANVKPGGRYDARAWFNDNPEALAEARRGRELHLSYAQIARYLVETYDYPFSSPEALRNALRD